MKQHWAEATTPPCTQQFQIPTLFCWGSSSPLLFWSYETQTTCSRWTRTQSFLLEQRATSRYSLLSRDVKASLTDSAKTSMNFSLVCKKTRCLYTHDCCISMAQNLSAIRIYIETQLILVIAQFYLKSVANATNHGDL